MAITKMSMNIDESLLRDYKIICITANSSMTEDMTNHIMKVVRENKIEN